VGTLGGCEDQAAILLSESGKLKQFRFVPVRLERTISLPPGFCFAVGSSGVIAEKTGGARESYNAAARATASIYQRWRDSTGGTEATLGDVVSQRIDGLPRLRELLGEEPALLTRLEQFVEESEELVPEAAGALAAGETARFGSLVARSQAGAERGLGNQIPETIHLVGSARRLGAAAASAFGAGFGGSVWALVEEASAAEFLSRWSADYAVRFPARASQAEFFQTRPGPGAVRLG
jgi:galactokinase